MTDELCPFTSARWPPESNPRNSTMSDSPQSFHTPSGSSPARVPYPAAARRSFPAISPDAPGHTAQYPPRP